MLAELLVDIDPFTHTQFWICRGHSQPDAIGPIEARISDGYRWCPRLLYHVPRSLDLGIEERKRNSFMPSLLAGLHSIQSSAICDPTKSPSAGWLGTIVARVQCEEVEERGRMVCGLRRSPVADPER